MSSFADFAARFAIGTSVELDADRRPVLDGGESEAIASTFTSVDLVVGGEEEAADGMEEGGGGAAAAAGGANGAAMAPAAAAAAAQARAVGTGALFVTTRRVVWVPETPGAPCASLTYRQIVMHAVATDVAAFPRPCVYLQLDDDDERQRREAEAAAGNAGGGGDEGEEGVEDDGPAPELRLVPADASQVEPLFQALCDNSALNPDTDAEEQADAPMIFDRLEAMAGAMAAAAAAGAAGAGAAAGGAGAAPAAGAEEDPDEEEAEEGGR